MMMLVTTDQKIYYEGVKQAKSALCANGAQKHCGCTWDKLIKIIIIIFFFFFLVWAAINSPASLILLLSWKWLPFKLNHVFWSKKKNQKFFRDQYVIAWDLKILCRYTAQSDEGSIAKCIWFTAGEMVDGSIISKFPGIARSIDYLISHFSQKVHQRQSDKEMLMELGTQLADEWMRRQK